MVLAVAVGDHDPDAPVENEMHGIGGVAGVDDDLAGIDLQALAAMDQFRRVFLGAENAYKPVAQGSFFVAEALMLRDDLVLAPLQRMIEFGHDADVLRDELARSQRLFRRRRKMHQHQFDAAVLGGALDLRKTVGRRGIDAGDELEVEHQKAAFRMPRQQRLDVLVEPVGRAEEQIALQVQPLDLAAMRG